MKDPAPTDLRLPMQGPTSRQPPVPGNIGPTTYDRPWCLSGLANSSGAACSIRCGSIRMDARSYTAFGSATSASPREHLGWVSPPPFYGYGPHYYDAPRPAQNVGPGPEFDDE